MPETKDWTWVLHRPCPECGLEAGSVPVGELGRRVRETAATWRGRLALTDAARRPAPSTWSPLEYGAHVRDVLLLAEVRLTALLEEEDAVFADWDADHADATAVEQRYGELDPQAVAEQVEQAAAQVSGLLDALPSTADGPGAAVWQRPGRRSNGSVFTVASLGRYVLHDVVHHEEDVRTAR